MTVRVKTLLIIAATLLALFLFVYCFYRPAFWQFTLFALLVGAVFTLVLEKVVLARIDQLHSHVRKIGQLGDPSARVMITGHDELSDLAIAVNEMLGMLELSQVEMQTNEALLQSEDHYRRLIDHSPDGVFISCENKLVFVNAAGLALLGTKDARQVLNTPTMDLIPAEMHEFVRENLPVEDGPGAARRLELRATRLDGLPIDLELAMTRLHYQGTLAVQIIARDITERKRVEERLHQLAYYDALTKLPNRQLFLDCRSQTLKKAKRAKTRVAVLILDLDRFKEVNDTLGHNIGDHLLQEVAVRLIDCVRRCDTVARIGGDEFAIIIPDLKQPEQLETTLQRIQADFVASFTFDAHEIYISPSIGIGIYPTDTTELDLLMQYADMAMHRAKSLGRNTYYFYSPEIGEVVAERHSMESQLRQAIKEQEFELHYQPQVDLETRQIIGVEALIRWHHPQLGWVPPNQFIPLAEETGQIIAIDEWVLQTACKQLCAWQREGLPEIRMAVNISARHFHRPELVQTVASVLKSTGLSPELLEIEITETAAMQNLEQTLEILDQLKDLGIHIAIDDFGIGYSSFIYLKRFPVHTLKIDQAFMRDIITDTDSAVIVEAIIGLTRSLKHKVLAEAVETPEQLAFLQAHGCDLAQGYLFARPMPAEKLEHLLTHQEDLFAVEPA